MKRLWLFAILAFFFVVAARIGVCNVDAADDQYVCGKTYMFFQNEVTYLLKFTSYNPDIPCTSGYATLYWLNTAASYEFSIDSREVITIKTVGRLFAIDTSLIFLDTATLVFDEF